MLYCVLSLYFTYWCIDLFSFAAARVFIKLTYLLTYFGEGMPQILDMHFQIALTSEHVADFG